MRNKVSKTGATKPFPLAFCILAVLWLIAPPAGLFAQADSGRISGMVEDESHGAINGAKVTVTNTRTGQTRTVETKDDGSFLISPLRASTYAIRIEKEQFAPVEDSGLQVAIGLEIHRTYTMRLASTATTITVTSDEELPMDTTSARIGINLTQRELQSLPVNGRQLSQLVLQAPGATNAGTGNFQDIRFSGQATEQNAIKYDGVEGSAIIDAAPGNLNGETPSPFKLQSSLENVQEFRVESNNYPAEYGTGDGGQISIVTKSGSNAYHGAAYEFFRNDALDARNYFDLAAQKTKLRQNQFGASLGGPVVKDKAFFFGYYEGYRLRAGTNAIESAPSSRFLALPDCLPGQTFPSTQCVNPEIKKALPAFHSPDAVLIQPDTTTTLGNSSLDVYQLAASNNVDENSFGGRLDFHLGDANTMFLRAFRDQAANSYFEGITGRQVRIRALPQNAVYGWTSMLRPSLVNEAKIGYNGALTRINGIGPTVNGIDFSQIALNATGGITLSGIAGQGGSSAGLAVPGGLVRANSATNGRGQPYTPYTISFLDDLSWTTGIHNFKFGAEVRMVRMYTDRLGGATYSFSNLTDLINGKLSSVDDLADVSAPSPYNNGATGNRFLKQQYYIGYLQDEMRLRPDLTLNLGLRYEYYTPLTEDRNLYVLFDTATGTLFSPRFCYNPFAGLSSVCTPQNQSWYRSNTDNFLPRIGLSWSPGSKSSGLFGGGRTVIRTGFGIFTGPGQTEDQVQPAESDRVWTTPSNPGFYCGQAPTCPTSAAALTANFLANPNNRAARVRAYDSNYAVPERIYQYTVSWQQQWGAGFVSTIAYVGSQGRNLFLRNIANRIVSVRTNTATGAAIPVRQFDIDCSGGPAANPACPAADANTVLHPYAEIDFKSSGGYDSYNALQMQLLRRFGRGLSLSAQYTYSKSFGNSGGSNEALTSSDPFDYNLDKGYNTFDLRHNFNASALYRLPFAANQSSALKQVIANWEVGAIVSARSGFPVPVQITRPDVVFQAVPGTTFNGNSIAGQIFSSPVLNNGTTIFCPASVCTQAIINTPGGGNSRNVRRPDLVPGVPFFLPNGNLNPAAFAIPLPGTFGNLTRNLVHGKDFAQADLVIAKRFPIRESSAVEFRTEIFNLFNNPNFANPPAQLGNVLPSAPGAANTLQPGQAYTPATAGSFGKLNSTVGTTVGLGTNRQVQFAMRVNF